MTIDEMVSEAFAAGCPKTQNECCAIAALVAVSLEDREWTEALVLEAAASMASGIFGPVFKASGERSFSH
jgi:hypothetical protein